MNIPQRAVIGAVALAATLVLAGGAFAHGGHGSGMRGPTDSTALLKHAAESLDVTLARLQAAIADDAKARIDAYVKAGRLDEDQAADLKDAVADTPMLAQRLTTASGVARNLGVTKAKLDTAFRAARKAEMTEHIDQALADKRIDADQAADMKDRLGDMTLPGYAGGMTGGMMGGMTGSSPGRMMGGGSVGMMGGGSVGMMGGGSVGMMGGGSVGMMGGGSVGMMGGGFGRPMGGGFGHGSPPPVGAAAVGVPL